MAMKKFVMISRMEIEYDVDKINEMEVGEMTAEAFAEEELFKVRDIEVQMIDEDGNDLAEDEDRGELVAFINGFLRGGTDA